MNLEMHCDRSRATHHSSAPLCAPQAGTSSKSMLDPYVALVEAWLGTAPHLSAFDILMRLEEQALDRFGKGQLRTLQRLVKGGDRKPPNSSCRQRGKRSPGEFLASEVCGGFH